MNTSHEIVAFDHSRHRFLAGDDAASAPVPHRPTFADALRRRGLLAQATLADGIAGAWNNAGDTWLAVTSVYEAHLRRVQMEQVLESSRGDA